MPDEVRAELKDPDLVNRVFYERFHTLLTARFVRRVDTAAFDMDAPPSDDEKRVGMIIGQSLHEGCSLDDVALATGLPPTAWSRSVGGRSSARNGLNGSDASARRAAVHGIRREHEGDPAEQEEREPPVVAGHEGEGEDGDPIATATTSDRVT